MGPTGQPVREWTDELAFLTWGFVGRTQEPSLLLKAAKTAKVGQIRKKL